MLIKLQESLSENLQAYLATYFAKNNISQSFTIEFHGDNDCGLDLVFAEGPLEGEVISYSRSRKFLAMLYIALPLSIRRLHQCNTINWN